MVIKQIVHKVFSTLMALVVLFSTVSFTIEKHYCGDVLVDVSVFDTSVKCGMESLEVIQKKACCKDEIDVLEGQDELSISSPEDLTFDQQKLLAVFTMSYLGVFKSIQKQTIPNKDYSPPSLISDIQVLDQVFLI